MIVCGFFYDYDIYCLNELYGSDVEYQAADEDEVRVDCPQRRLMQSIKRQYSLA